MTLERLTSQPENPFAKLVGSQEIAVIPEFTLESGDVLHQVPVAYKTWGKLNDQANNVMVICHALTGSADVADWWGPLMGVGRAFDPERFYIICINALGSPYGSASPCTTNPDTGDYYGPEFPLTTIKDDAKIQKLLLDDLGVKEVAVVIGGSMGGMLVLEYAYFGPKYVRCIVPIATCASHSAWAISWGEAQRQSIYSDPKYLDGYYAFSDPPAVGLGAARMSALLTYRSRNSFESKFGRAKPDPLKHKQTKSLGLERAPSTPSEERWAIHNHGHRQGKKLSHSTTASPNGASNESPEISPSSSVDSLTSLNSVSSAPKPLRRPQTYFTAQSYLRYQGAKFVERFDPNCYIAISRKLDTHDVSRGRGDEIEASLRDIEQPTLVIGISSDGLFTFTEQERLAEHIPNSRLVKIDSPEGHDAFLLEFAEINQLIINFLKEQIPDIMNSGGREFKEQEIGQLTQSSVFGEAETVTEDMADITRW
ncbi:homoserine O-acetyltransferase [Sugiyamaella lignohabitans]|uniref:Homoserine O-acetyltransferase n=1 Tax=Sugiyamaella lignohabitans TaxID=796027 RepID=A0A167FDU2_9ASCO|nr:homoserine O-acetyltransferase [Sugiyamaella lignohabitans]ANB15173.1 homoserine O-acetyltransferase [Sugiyamaella lignohabitans]